MKINTTITDKEIANAIRKVEKDKATMTALKSLSESDLKDLLQKERNKKSSRQSLRLILYPIISIAAIVALVILPSVFRDKQMQNLYTAYFEAPTNQYFELSARGVSETVQQSVIETFFKAYDKHEYDAAIQSLSFNNKELQQFPELLFYVAVCQLEVGKIAEAEKNLLFLFSVNPDWQDVSWYLSLAYLKSGKKEDAKTLLAKIRDDGGVYAGKAAEILDEL